MKRIIFNKIIVFVLALAMALPVFGILETQAATKPSLSSTELTIGIGSYGQNSGYFHKTNTRYRVDVVNSQKGASYTFTSSNKKVATVKASKATGYITGVKAGTATITVKQTLKGKTTTVGKCKVTVKNATVEATYIATEELGVGKDIQIGGWEYEPICYIQNYNPAAKYTFKSNSKNFKMSQVKVDASYFIGVGYFNYAQKYTATKPGTYTVTLTETYNKKTRTVGKFKVKVYSPEIQSSLELYVGQECFLTELAKYCKTWIVDYKEEDILENTSYDDVFCVRAAKAGTAELKYYYPGKKEGEFGDLIGTCKVTVKDVKVTDIDVIETQTSYVGDDGEFSYSVVTDSEDVSYLGKVMITSSDENVITVDENGWYTAVGEGTAIVTITAGDITKSITVTVKS